MNFSEPADAPSRLLEGKKLAIVNIRGNKFDRMYAEFFARRNQVRLVNAQGTKDVAPAMDAAMNWADVVLSCWADEAMMYMTPTPDSSFNRQPSPSSSASGGEPAFFSFVRSWEILNPQFMQAIEWGRLRGLIFVADHIRELFGEMWAGRASQVPQGTIYNSVSIHQAPFREHSPGPKLAYIGFLGPKKGITLLLQCLMAAREVNHEFKLHIAGRFQDKRFEVYVRHLLADAGLVDHVVFHGWVQDIFAFLNQMDYLVSTSPWEGCPNNVIEAMSCGVRPLIHNWRGARQIFPPQLSFNSISQMKSMLRDSNYDSRGYRQYAEKHFNAEIQLSKLSGFMANLI
jgi:glycosyltransferase involved in cell wall biosynthesis